MIGSIITPQTVTVVADSRYLSTDRTNPNFDRIVEEVKAMRRVPLDQVEAYLDRIAELIEPANAIQEAIADLEYGNIKVENGNVYYNGEAVHSSLTRRILDIIAAQENVLPWVRFMENVYQNPFEQARTELYDFLEQADIPITEDGCFLPYKIVRDDYRDIWTGKIDNSVGRTVSMDRSKVDPNRNNLCSTGLHFCSKGYLGSYGGGGSRVMILKVNPKDVVSIPTDYNFAKGRCWRYQVVGEMDPEEAAQYVWAPTASVEYEYDEEEYDEEHDDDWDDDEEVERKPLRIVVRNGTREWVSG